MKCRETGAGHEARYGLFVQTCARPNCATFSASLKPCLQRDRLQGRAEDWQVAVAADKYRILTPVLLTPSGTPEHAKAIRDLAAQPAHQIGGTWMSVAEWTLYDWLKAAEDDVSGLLPGSRSDRGQRRVRISRAWDTGCGLPVGVQEQIAGKLAGTARGLLAKGRSEQNVRTLCAVELQNGPVSVSFRSGPRCAVMYRRSGFCSG